MKEENKGEIILANFATVLIEGQRKVERAIYYYNLDVIISIGYRVNSYQRSTILSVGNTSAERVFDKRICFK